MIIHASTQLACLLTPRWWRWVFHLSVAIEELPELEAWAAACESQAAHRDLLATTERELVKAARDCLVCDDTKMNIIRLHDAIDAYDRARAKE